MSLPADAYEAAVATVAAANREGVPLKLLGGQAVRYLTPDFPPRRRGGQDVDFASVSTAKRAVMELLAGLGFEAFSDRIDRMPLTLDVTDLLLSKLQVVQQNEKDVHDIVYLLAAHELGEGDPAGTIGPGRFTEVLAGAWDWWRTATGNLDRVVQLVRGELARLVPAGAPHDPVEHAIALRRHAEVMPKSLRWKLRARLGERAQWYELPEEVGH